MRIVTVKERKWQFLAIALLVVVLVLVYLNTQNLFVALGILGLGAWLYLSIRQKSTTVFEMAEKIAEQQKQCGIIINPKKFYVWNKEPQVYSFEFPDNSISPEALTITTKSEIPVIGIQDMQRINLASLKREIEDFEIERIGVLKGKDKEVQYKVMKELSLVPESGGE